MIDGIFRATAFANLISSGVLNKIRLQNWKCREYGSVGLKHLQYQLLPRSHLTWFLTNSLVDSYDTLFITAY